MQQENRRNVMSDARVLSATIEAVEDAEPLDVVHVRLTAQARDTEVPVGATDEDIRRALARTPVEPYTEIWSLVRRRGVQSKPADFPVGRACPSCGAPLDGGETIKCKLLRHPRLLRRARLGPRRDHAARRVASEGRSRRRPRGAPAARSGRRARSPRRPRLLRVLEVGPGRARPGSSGRFASAPRPRCSRGRTWTCSATQGASDVAVGGADLVGCELDGPDGFDRVYVEILWSARFGRAAPTPCRVVMRLARRTGAVSRLSMTALVCQACGAPLVDSDTTRCDHCGAELAAGDQAWVLDAVLSPGPAS